MGNIYVHLQLGMRGMKRELEEEKKKKNGERSTVCYLAVNTLIAVGGLNSQDDGGWGVLAQHQRVSKRLEDGSIVVDVLLLLLFHFVVSARIGDVAFRSTNYE